MLHVCEFALIGWIAAQEFPGEGIRSDVAYEI
ncbi:hypothetical protein J2X13_005911, partial [Aminobacter aminovorans]|nr:hypothetical protein [Aminobacter aminovorans]